MEFTKMHGIGNDYVYVDCFRQPTPKDPKALAIRVSCPHTGIGSDGLILVEPCPGADARMRIFNKDGSESEMCGNGIRCVGKLMYDSGLCRKPVLNIMTGGGMRELELFTENGTVTGARVDMGKPVIDAQRTALWEDGKRFEFITLSLGNPHAVTEQHFPESDAEFYRLGARFETDPAFPNGANISFIRREGPGILRARIWERGSGPTLACGSGATAGAIAAFTIGMSGERTVVRLPGGDLTIEYCGDHAFMSGPAATVFTGTWPEET